MFVHFIAFNEVAGYRPDFIIAVIADKAVIPGQVRRVAEYPLSPSGVLCSALGAMTPPARG
jgi:hypothetical protein